MAKREVTGRPRESDEEPDLQDLRDDYIGTPKERDGVPFEHAYCLAGIHSQPDDYDGPEDRYCCKRTRQGRTDYCSFHEHYENLHDPHLASMTHGVRATREGLRKSFSEKEQKAFEEIVYEWSDYMETDNPAAMDTLESLAIEIIREVRADAVLEDEGLKKFRKVWTEEGPARDDMGNVVEEDEAHYLLSERRSIRNSIEKMKKNLGLTPKHRDKMTAESEKTDSMRAFMDDVNEAIESEDAEYDPDDFE